MQRSGRLFQQLLRRGFPQSRDSWMATFSTSASVNKIYDLTEQEEAEQLVLKQKQLKAEQKEYFANKKGRGWSDEWDIEGMLESKITKDDLLEWEKKYVSRISNERLQVTKQLTMEDLAKLPLPAAITAHPATSAKLYALTRRRLHQNIVKEYVREMAEPRVKEIYALKEWEEKQTAVDILFEEIEMELKQRMLVLGKHPDFGLWVERALENYLKELQKQSKASTDDTSTIASTNDTSEPSAEKSVSDSDPETLTEDIASSSSPNETKPNIAKETNSDHTAIPIFLDCFRSDVDSKDDAAPTILHPLRPNSKRPTQGRMVEEWELAADRSTRRIMIRQCTRSIAEELKHGECKRIVVHGRHGTGKSAALAAIVTAARSSPDTVVMYLPEGDNMSHNGFYVEPNLRREGYYDLPVLQAQVCGDLLKSHTKEFEAFTVDDELLQQYCTEAQLVRLRKNVPAENSSLVALLEYGRDHTSLAPAIYRAAVDILMKQDSVDFFMVMDEFNCLFPPLGQYFHEHYDEKVVKSIPCHQISLFEPIMNAMGLKSLPSDDDDDSNVHPTPSPIQRGGVVVATTESHAVPRNVTDAFVQMAKDRVKVVEVPRLSHLEVEHMLSHYEAVGIGKLRLDQGATVMNPQEVAYLRMVSGGEAQHLMNACMW